MTPDREFPVERPEPAQVIGQTKGGDAFEGDERRDDSDRTQGWIIFQDGDGNHRPDSPGELLRVEAAPRGPELRIVSNTGRPKVTFLADGSAGGSNLTIRLCRGGVAKAQ